MRKLKQVRPEDFDVEALLAAAREGRLYVDDSKKEVSRDIIINEVRTYVARISPLVARRFRSSIDELWEQILSTEEFVEFLTPGSKARMCRDFDKYNVMRIIGVLREKGVYEQYSDRKFDALLEPDVEDSRYRRYLGMGIEQRSLLVKLRQIVNHFEF